MRFELQFWGVMKKLAAQTAIAMAFLSGVASAQTVVTGQSVLERVLSSLNTTSAAPVNGTFANIAENLPVVTDGTSGVILNNVDGSVNNSLNSAMTSVANAQTTVNDIVTALQGMTFSIGNISTTALGAVNTGTVQLGVNSDVKEAVAGTSMAISNTVTQVGGSADTGALVLNVASNATGVTGAVSNTVSGLSGTIGNISTTALGAVNTGTITNGVNAAANGIVAGIVGTQP